MMQASSSSATAAASTLGNAVRYRRLSTEDHSDAALTADALKKQRTDAMEKITIKLQALAWLLVASVVVYYTDFFKVLFTDERVNRLYFNVAVMGLGINLCIAIYLTLYLPCIKNIHLDWSVYCPRMIPTATIVGLVTAFTLIRSLWPVWGFLTPLILLVVFIGFIFILHFLPWPC